MDFQTIGISVQDGVGGILCRLDHPFDVEIVDSLMGMITVAGVMAVEV